ncbi:MAG: HDOD domain-containing protein [Candidatus Cloacimonetes bacterium]|nr:HDOD domain-containing protein [Candidatus Cloacimonadota bacterium]
MSDLIILVNQTEISSIRTSLFAILKAFSDPQVNARLLAENIEKDPPLSSRIMRIANSSYYGSRRKIESIKEAIIRIGQEEVKTLALSQKVWEIFANSCGNARFNMCDLWKHSIAVAIFSQKVYRQELRLSGGNAYAAGLLHDIGIIVINQFLQDEFEMIIKSDESFTDKEVEALSFTHAEIGAELISGWGLPDDIHNAIRLHHQPFLKKESKEILSGVIFIADFACMQENIGFVDEKSYLDTNYQLSLDNLKISHRSAEVITAEVIEDIEHMEEEGWFKV